MATDLDRILKAGDETVADSRVCLQRLVTQSSTSVPILQPPQPRLAPAPIPWYKIALNALIGRGRRW